MPTRPPCAVEVALSVLGGRWRTLVLAQLKQRALHHGELRRSIPGISQKELTRALRGLEEDGFIERTELPGKVRRVRYALTTQGRALSSVLQALYDFGVDWATARGLPLAPPVAEGGQDKAR